MTLAPVPSRGSNWRVGAVEEELKFSAEVVGCASLRICMTSCGFMPNASAIQAAALLRVFLHLVHALEDARGQSLDDIRMISHEVGANGVDVGDELVGVGGARKDF